MSQVELQRSIERFTSKFIEDITLAGDALPLTDAEQQRAVLRRVLLYASTALDVASGPQPEMNVLDMLVFAILSRRTLECCWISELTTEDAKCLIMVLAEFERQLWEISDRMIDGAQQQQLRELIRAWNVAHPDEARVEWVRFEDISPRGGPAAQADARTARGLLRSIKSAARTADQALLLGERALFVTRRLPSVLRLHIRVVAQETLVDVGKLRAYRTQQVQAQEVRPVLVDRVLRRLMNSLGSILFGWISPRESPRSSAQGAGGAAPP